MTATRTPAGPVHDALARAVAVRMAGWLPRRADRLDTLSGWVGRPVSSSFDLTTDEARVLLAALSCDPCDDGGAS